MVSMVHPKSSAAGGGLAESPTKGGVISSRSTEKRFQHGSKVKKAAQKYSPVA